LPGLLRALGADPGPVLARSGISPGAFGNPENRIGYNAFGRLLEQAALATQNPQFGLLAGRLWHVDDLGLLAEAVLNSRNVREALAVLTSYQYLNSSGGLPFLIERANVVDLGYAIYSPGVVGVDQLYDMALAALFNFMRDLLGPAWVPAEAFVPHHKPADTTNYRNLFRVQPHFNSEFCALRFPASWMEKPLPNASPEQRRAALQRAYAMRPDLRSLVYREMRTLLIRGKSSGDDLAETLAMNRRTLNRKLQEQGTTFQEVLDQVRYECARQLLFYSDVSLDDIAASLGYAGVSPFMRTFRRWTGMTPGRWRREARHHAARLPGAGDGAVIGLHSRLRWDGDERRAMPVQYAEPDRIREAVVKAGAATRRRALSR
jgi:AraC-like DNA-binding protein